MPILRLTGFFRDDDAHGWSEQHDLNPSDPIGPLNQYLTAFDTLMMNGRRPLLAGDGYYIGCRASYRTADGRISASNLLRDPPVKGTTNIGSHEIWMNNASAAVKVRMQDVGSLGNSDMYLRGVWDECMVGGVLDFEGTYGKKWKQLADTYISALIGGGYGWSGLSAGSTVRGLVPGYVVNANGTVTFTISVQNGAPMPPNGTRVSVNFARINHSASVLNRSLVCMVTSPTTLTTVEVVATAPFVSAGTFIVPVKQFRLYGGASYFKLSGRKMGRPFGAGRGRLSARALS